MGKMAHRHAPAILLLEGDAQNTNDSVKRWFEESRFATREAADLLDLLEEISDFTVRERPDVFLVEVDCISDDLSAIKEFIQTPDGDVEMPIFAVSGSKCPERDDCFIGNLEQVADQLEHFIPPHFGAQQAAL